MPISKINDAEVNAQHLMSLDTYKRQICDNSRKEEVTLETRNDPEYFSKIDKNEISYF
jgi:hypothetical protein